MYDKNKADFKFVFWFASPNYILYEDKKAKKKVKIDFPRLDNVEEYTRIKQAMYS